MTLVLVEVPNEAAVQALSQQENIRVVGVITPPPASAPPQAAPPRKWAGALSDSAADSLRAHVEQVRSEWERDF